MSSRLILSTLSFGLCLAVTLHATAPEWWSSRGVIATDPVTHAPLAANDYAVINQGQLKNFVVAAVAELNANLPNGAGTDLNNIVAAWNAAPTGDRQDFAATNIGQVKFVVAKIYDRLAAEGVTTGYPWTSSPNPASDNAMVNIGQVKALLSFDLTTSTGDLDHDGLTFAQETALGTNPALEDTDGDGIPDGLDSAPLDPNQSLPASDPTDHTPPVILLIQPTDAVLNP
jgi:hypothetical protein